MEENEAGEMVPKRKVQTGPWKMVQQQQAQPEEAPAPGIYYSSFNFYFYSVQNLFFNFFFFLLVEKQRPEPSQSSSSSSYVVPHLRNQPRQSSNPSNEKFLSYSKLII